MLDVNHITLNGSLLAEYLRVKEINEDSPLKWHKSLFKDIVLSISDKVAIEHVYLILHGHFQEH